MTRKLMSTILAVLATLWLPLTLFINPGWVTFILFTPYALLFLTPLSLLLVNRTYKGQDVPPAMFWVQVGFYVSWALMGVFILNADDSMQYSLFTRNFGNIADPLALIDFSRTLGNLCFFLAAAFLLAAIGMRTFMRKTQVK